LKLLFSDPSIKASSPDEIVIFVIKVFWLGTVVTTTNSDVVSIFCSGMHGTLVKVAFHFHVIGSIRHVIDKGTS
jgi:hypothetical protein